MRHKLFLKSDDVNFYEDAFAVYSLRKVFKWTNAVIQLRRTSDNATTSVYFDSNGEISLNSFIGDETTPTTTTLGTWIGSNSATVRRWYKMTADNISTNEYLSAISASIQPLFINSGVINTKNGKPTINFDGVDDYFQLNTGSFSELDSGKLHSIISVSHNNTSNSIGGILTTNSIDVSRYQLVNDRRAAKRASFVDTFGVPVQGADLINQQDNSNQRILSSVFSSGSILSSYYNSVLQNTIITTISYQNTSFDVGVQFLQLTPLNGGIQELILYPSDKTSNLSEIHADINDYYNIY